MKKILSLSLVVLMLFCMVPFSVFAAYEVDLLPGTNLPLNRLAEFNISTNGGYYNANSGVSLTTGSFVTSANALGIVDGFQGTLTVRVYSADNAAADLQVFNHYVGAVYFMGAQVSPTFYPLGDLLYVLYNSFECTGMELNCFRWDSIGFISESFHTQQILGALLNGSSYNWTAEWKEVTVTTCEDHDFSAGLTCSVCGATFDDTYVVGDYTYRAIGSTEVPQNMHGLGVMGGWVVYATDKTQSTYGEIRETLHGYPVTFMYKTFENCVNMTVAPDVPAQVEVMYNAFKGSGITATPDLGNVQKIYGAFKNCKNLTSVGAIPETVTDMTFAFSGCTALVNAPAIPASVVNLTGAFKNCTSLKAAPDVSNAAFITEVFNGCKNLTSVGAISETVTDMTLAFSGCTALVNAPTIPASVVNLTRAFKNCTALKAAPDVSNAAIITEAFDGCTSLTGNVSFTANQNSKAFRNTAVTSAVVGATTIENSCFNNSDLKEVTYAGTSAQWLAFPVGSYNAAVLSANVKLGNKAADPSVVVKNNRTYVCDIDGENVKDFFIAKGTQNTYADVKANNVVRVTAAKIGGADIYTYGAVLDSEVSNYTLFIRNNDGTAEFVYFTVA